MAAPQIVVVAGSSLRLPTSVPRGTIARGQRRLDSRAVPKCAQRLEASLLPLSHAAGLKSGSKLSDLPRAGASHTLRIKTAIGASSEPIGGTSILCG